MSITVDYEQEHYTCYTLRQNIWDFISSCLLSAVRGDKSAPTVGPREFVNLYNRTRSWEEAIVRVITNRGPTDLLDNRHTVS